MKKFLMFFLALGLASCSDDDNNETVDNGLHDPYTGEVSGAWRTMQVAASDYVIVPDCENDVIAEVNYYYIFNTDGTVDVYNYCDIDQEIDDELPVTVGTYQTTGNVFTITINGVEGKAHMVDYLEESDSLELRFDIGSSGLWYGYNITIMEQ